MILRGWLCGEVERDNGVSRKRVVMVLVLSWLCSCNERVRWMYE